MKLVPLSLVLALAVLAGSAAPAGAASSSRTGPEAAFSFCGVARGVAREIVSSGSVNRATPANLKTFYGKIAAAEPALLASASGPVKANLRPVLGFVNLVIVDLKKVNWNAGKLGPYLPALTARGEAIQKPLGALRAYFKGTCKLNV